jgi:hypothetical protein
MSAQAAGPTRDAAPAPQPPAAPRGALWPLAVVVLLALSSGAVAFDLDSPARTAVTIAFLLVGPGLALAELMHIRGVVEQISIAIGASLAVDTLVAVGLMYLGRYTYELAFGIIATLTALTLAACVLRAELAPDADPPPGGAVT